LSLTMAPHWDTNLSLIFFGPQGWPSSDTSVTSHRRPLVVYDPEAYKN
jgi:hypothetical protein